MATDRLLRSDCPPSRLGDAEARRFALQRWFGCPVCRSPGRLKAAPTSSVHMPTITRREQLKLLALSALAPLQAPPAPRPGSGQADPGRGHRPAHPAPVVQRSGRPARQRAGDAQPRPPLRRPHVQRRRHDARRHRSARLKPVGVLHRAATTRARITCRSPTTCCCSPTAPTSWRCSPTTTCAAISRTRSPTASPTGRSSAPA